MELPVPLTSYLKKLVLYFNGSDHESSYIAARSFCIYSLIPIPKGLKNLAEIKNYCIALSSLFCKLFGHCIIHDQLIALKTDDLQFAYKANTSTVQCVSNIQETNSYYVNNGSHVVMSMLNASQAFDRVNLLTLSENI